MPSFILNRCVYLKNLCRSNVLSQFIPKCKYHRQALSNLAIQEKRIGLFENEQKRQKAHITDVSKIIVKYKGDLAEKEVNLAMNKDMSTPYDCSKHISQMIMERSVVAEVNGEIWDLCQPLKEDCELELLHFKDADPYFANKAFWRSASIMLGCILESTFKEGHHVDLCSFPRPDVKSGSFLYDIAIEDIESWKPSNDDMRALSTLMVKLSMENHFFERLDVDASIASKMFEDNKYKLAQIPHIAATSSSGNSVTIYRLKNFIEISRGPLMGRTGHVGRCTVTNFIPFETDGQKLYRVQGVALPGVLRINSFTYGILEDRARKLNVGPIPLINEWMTQPSSTENLIEAT